MKPLILAVAALLSAVPAGAAPDAHFDNGSAFPSPAAAGDAAPKTPTSAPNDPRLWVILNAGDAKTRSAAANAGVSIEELLPGRVGGFATPQAVARAQAAGLKVLSSAPVAARLRALGFPEQDKAYHTYAQTVAQLKALAAKAPDIASLFSIGKTVQGRDIWALRLCPDAKGRAASKLPGALFVLTLRHYSGVVQSLRRSFESGYGWAGPGWDDSARVMAHLDSISARIPAHPRLPNPAPGRNIAHPRTSRRRNH